MIDIVEVKDEEAHIEDVPLLYTFYMSTAGLSQAREGEGEGEAQMKIVHVMLIESLETRDFPRQRVQSEARNFDTVGLYQRYHCSARLLPSTDNKVANVHACSYE